MQLSDLSRFTSYVSVTLPEYVFSCSQDPTPSALFVSNPAAVLVECVRRDSRQSRWTAVTGGDEVGEDPPAATSPLKGEMLWGENRCKLTTQEPYDRQALPDHRAMLDAVPLSGVYHSDFQ